MAQDFDQFPIYDELIKNQDGRLTSYMSDYWQSFLAAFYENLIGYLSQYGMFIPKLTTDQRDDIQSPISGQLIYNTDANEPQIYIDDGVTPAWKTVVTM